MNKNLKYEDLINKQSADGSWSVDLLSFILGYVPDQCQVEIKNLICSAQKDTQKSIVTALVLAILMKRFEDARDEWKLIEKKAKSFVKQHPCAQADQKKFENLI